MRTVIVDTGTANVGSVFNMCRRIGDDPVVSGDPDRTATADRLPLPGVGVFHTGMAGLHGTGLAEALRLRAEEGVPVLGICLGMHLLAGTRVWCVVGGRG